MAWQPLEKGGENSVDVIIVGAGISGINFAYRLQERNPGVTYAILEGRHEIGGTWSLFKYPGIRSDSDLYTFGFSWKTWNREACIAPGSEIKSYLKEAAKENGIDKHIRYNTKVQSANWSEDEKTWTFNATAGDKPITYKSRFMLLGTGYYDYDEPMQATIPGIENFQGRVIHPQFWPEDLDYTNKDVVVIGSGATAVTVLPIMAKTAKHVTMLQRSPGYVVAIPSADGYEKFVRAYLSFWPALQSFLFRAKWIWMSFFVTRMSRTFPEFMKWVIGRRMGRLLPKSVPRDPHFTPSYYPWQQRMCLCPDGDFFEGLKTGKATVETGVIKTVTKNSIQLTSGKELRPDIIITATGLKVQFAGGIKLTLDGKPFDIPSKFIWRGLMLEGLPNACFSFGYVDASWTLGADATAQLISRMLKTMKDEGVVEVRPKRTEEELTTLKKVSPLRLTSTYVTKAASVTPSAGDSGPWVPRSLYVKDIWMAWYGDVHKGTEWVKSGQKYVQ